MFQEKAAKLVTEEPLIENLNRLEPEAIEASGIDEAIKALRYVLYNCINFEIEQIKYSQSNFFVF